MQHVGNPDTYSRICIAMALIKRAIGASSVAFQQGYWLPNFERWNIFLSKRMSFVLLWRQLNKWPAVRSVSNVLYAIYGACLHAMYACSRTQPWVFTLLANKPVLFTLSRNFVVVFQADRCKESNKNLLIKRNWITALKPARSDTREQWVEHAAAVFLRCHSSPKS